MAKRVIALLGQPTYNEDGVAAEAIIPGHLVAGITSITKYATASGAAAPAFALERDEMPPEITSAAALQNVIDVPYAVGDTVKVGVFAKGQRVYALLASGVTVAADDRLEAGAIAGTLRKFTTGVVLARAREAVTAVVTPTRCTIEIM